MDKCKSANKDLSCKQQISVWNYLFQFIPGVDNRVSQPKSKKTGCNTQSSENNIALGVWEKMATNTEYEYQVAS